MSRYFICLGLFVGCAAESTLGSSSDKAAAEAEFDTGRGACFEDRLLPDSLKGDSVAHIELDPSDYNGVDTSIPPSEPEDPLFVQTLEVSNMESEISTEQSAFVAYFEGDRLWIEHRGANASCAEDWRGVTAYFEGDVFYVDYDLQGLSGCVFAVSYSLELSNIATNLVNNQLYRVEAGGDIQYAQYEAVAIDYQD